MRISDLSAWTLSSPIDPPQKRRFYGGVRRLLKRDAVLVRLETTDGAVGFAPGGASSSAMREYFEGASHGGFVDLLESDVADAVSGADVDDPERLADRVRDLGLPRLLESQAISAVDVAAHDVWGKAAGAPVYELLAEEAPDVTTSLPLYASAGMYMEPEGYAEQAAAIRERGFGGYKYRPGLGPDEDRRTLRLLRERVGNDMDLMVDAHTWWKLGERSYTFDEIVALLDDLTKHDPCWIEEPVEPGDHGAYARLSERTDVSLAGGESEESPEGLIALTEDGRVDFLQGDVRHHEGFTGTMRAARHCAGRDVRFVPHNFGTTLGLVANAHLTAAAPETRLLEYPVFGDDVAGMYPFPLAEAILDTDLDLADGTLDVPDDPGLGVEMNLDVVEEYPEIEGPWTEFEYDEGVTPDGE